MPSVFFSYSHADEALRDQLEKQLSMLKRQGVIETWHDRRIGAGNEIDAAIDMHIDSDEIILLLVSPDFLSSDYCYNVEMTRALARHDAGTANVIPVILRACDWHHAPFGKLLAVPRDGKPVTLWPDRDQAFLEVAQSVRVAAERLGGAPAARKMGTSPAYAVKGSLQTPDPLPSSPNVPTRSSNLRLAKAFSELDRDRFRDESFEYIARFFENSLRELESRNSGYQGVFKQVDARRFFATVYKDGRAVARATIYYGGGVLGNGINYVQGETTDGNTMNESLSVEADDQALFLKSFGMTSFGQDKNQKLSQAGAAELYWGIFIGPLQSRDQWGGQP
ncbi:MAG: toll/interleukin-1 receptor domain-containing protein [Pusillimonas sp.]